MINSAKKKIWKCLYEYNISLYYIMSRSKSSSSTENASVDEESTKFVYKPLEKRKQGLKFIVSSDANSKTIKKYIKLEKKTTSSIKMFTFHKNEVFFLGMLDHLKNNPKDIQNQDYKYFKYLFTNLPIGNDINTTDDSISIVQKRFNGMTLTDFINDSNPSPIMLAFVLIMIYVEIYKLYILGITHNDLHSGNILIVNAQSIDKWEHVGHETANTELITRLKAIPTTLTESKYIAKIDTIMRSAPIFIKIIDFDRATCHNNFTTHNTEKNALLSFGIGNPYILSLNKLNPSNDISLATGYIITKLTTNLKNKQDVTPFDKHGSLNYIYLHLKSNKEYWMTTYKPFLFQVKEYDNPLTPMNCISAELQTLNKALHASQQIQNTFDSSSLVPSGTTLMTSEELTPKLRSSGPPKQSSGPIQQSSTTKKRKID